MGSKKLLSALFLMSVLASAVTGCGGGNAPTPAGAVGSNPNPGGGNTTGTATLSWNAPTTNTDGTPLTDLAGYKVYYGTKSRTYTNSTVIGKVTTYTINLASGTYYFTVTAYDSTGLESTFSNEAAKTIP
jgi:hypothetical protein